MRACHRNPYVTPPDGPLDFGFRPRHGVTLDVADVVVSFVGASITVGRCANSLLALASSSRAWRFACMSNDDVWARQPCSALRCAAPLSVPPLLAALEAHRVVTGAYSTRRNWMSDAARCKFATTGHFSSAALTTDDAGLLPWRFGIHPGVSAEPQPSSLSSRLASWLPSFVSPSSSSPRPLRVAVLGLPDAGVREVMHALAGPGSAVTTMTPTIGIDIHRCEYRGVVRFTSLTTQPFNERPMLAVINNTDEILSGCDAIIYVQNAAGDRAELSSVEERLHPLRIELSHITRHDAARGVPLLVLLHDRGTPSRSTGAAPAPPRRRMLRSEQFANDALCAQAAEQGCRTWRVQECGGGCDDVVVAGFLRGCCGLRTAMNWLACALEEHARNDSTEIRKRMWRRGRQPVATLRVYGTTEKKGVVVN